VCWSGSSRIIAGIYSVASHVGRGGWTWYTGSAAWLYRAGITAILGSCLQGAFLLLPPCIRKAWPRFEIVPARYEIAVGNPNCVNRRVACPRVPVACLREFVGRAEKLRYGRWRTEPAGYVA
jgi:hypothetical protein